jgi:hypothetical protein
MLWRIFRLPAKEKRQKAKQWGYNRLSDTRHILLIGGLFVTSVIIEPGNASNEKSLILTDWLAEFIIGLMFPRNRSAFVSNSVWEVTKT